MVCGAEVETNKVNIRSAKFLRAVAAGKWIVNESWLQECKLRGTQAAEEDFEISGDKKSEVPSAPRRSRLAHSNPVRHWLCRTRSSDGFFTRMLKYSSTRADIAVI